MSKVKVYDGENVIGFVEYNDNLDVWNGRNYQNGGTGHHLGITKISDGRFVLIYGTDWQGGKDYAEVVSDEKAFHEIMEADRYDLLEEDKFKELKKFCTIIEV